MVAYGFGLQQYGLLSTILATLLFIVASVDFYPNTNATLVDPY
jgi:hypothetical protein